MSKHLSSIYKDVFAKSGFFLDHDNHDYGDDVLCYTLSSDYGIGHYWIYHYDNLFTVSIRNFIYNKDLFIECPSDDAVSITLIVSASGEELNPYKKLSCNTIRGHISQSDLYRVCLHKNIPIKTVGIEILPDYYVNYLKNICSDNYVNPKEAFLSIDGIKKFPELEIVMKQILNFKGSGMSTRLFYSGKVSEIISLVYEKTLHERDVVSSPFVLSDKDKECLTVVSHYLNDHYAYDVHLDDLTQIACMGKTKLKKSFKQMFHCTITEYIHNRRISNAEILLKNTDFTIQEISQCLGYKQPINFTRSFKNTIGLLPSEYRLLDRK